MMFGVLLASTKASPRSRASTQNRTTVRSRPVTRDTAVPLATERLSRSSPRPDPTPAPSDVTGASPSTIGTTSDTVGP